jgi:hypothetical protein
MQALSARSSAARPYVSLAKRRKAASQEAMYMVTDTIVALILFGLAYAWGSAMLALWADLGAMLRQPPNGQSFGFLAFLFSPSIIATLVGGFYLVRDKHGRGA